MQYKNQSQSPLTLNPRIVKSMEVLKVTFLLKPTKEILIKTKVWNDKSCEAACLLLPWVYLIHFVVSMWVSCICKQVALASVLCAPYSCSLLTVSTWWWHRWNCCWDCCQVKERHAPYNNKWAYLLANVWFCHFQIHPCPTTGSSQVFSSLQLGSLMNDDRAHRW